MDPKISHGSQKFQIGVKMGNALKTVIGAGMSPKNVHLIGYSIGSQLAAVMARQFNKNDTIISRITALNPINVTQFDNNTVFLNNKDAETVDVIYSDLEAINYTTPIGKLNFYPNGGKVQIGCLQNTSEF